MLRPMIITSAVRCCSLARCLAQFASEQRVNAVLHIEMIAADLDAQTRIGNASKYTTLQQELMVSPRVACSTVDSLRVVMQTVSALSLTYALQEHASSLEVQHRAIMFGNDNLTSAAGIDASECMIGGRARRKRRGQSLMPNDAFSFSRAPARPPSLVRLRCGPFCQPLRHVWRLAHSTRRVLHHS